MAYNKHQFWTSANVSVSTNYTVSLSDVGQCLIANNSYPITLTIPLTSSERFEFGDTFYVTRTTSHAVTLTGSNTTVTLRSANSGTRLYGMGSTGAFINLGGNDWVLGGDMAVNTAFDSNAFAYISAANITDFTQRQAINDLVIELKANNLWSGITVLYPFVGGSATTHSYNLKDPTTYQITWAGTVTHNANGITGDGSTGYGNTGFAPSIMPQNSLGAAIYVRSASTTSGHEFSAALNGVGTGDFNVIVRTTLQVSQTRGLGPTFGTTSPGFFSGSRIAVNDMRTFRNGVQTGITTTTATESNTTVPVYVLAFNNGFNVPNGFSNAQLSFATIKQGLSATEEAALYQIVQRYQTALGRAV